MSFVRQRDEGVGSRELPRLDGGGCCVSRDRIDRSEGGEGGGGGA